jgi:type IV pilus assembly protein PilE
MARDQELNMSIQRPSTLQRIASVGFTLIELLVVVAIIAILAAIAIPSYSKYVAKTNRSAAEGCLSEYANYMERYYATNLSYAQDTESTPVANSAIGSPSPLVLDCAASSQTGSNYQYSVSVPTATTYTLTATPINAQLTRDTQCSTLTWNQIGTRTSSGTGTLAQCWGG